MLREVAPKSLPLHVGVVELSLFLRMGLVYLSALDLLFRGWRSWRQKAYPCALNISSVVSA